MQGSNEIITRNELTKVMFKTIKRCRRQDVYKRKKETKEKLRKCIWKRVEAVQGKRDATEYPLNEVSNQR